MKVKSLSRVRLFVTQWSVAYQAPQSMGFCRQEYWSGLPLPSPGGLSNPGIEPGSPALQADSLPSKPPGKPEFQGWNLSNYNKKDAKALAIGLFITESSVTMKYSKQDKCSTIYCFLIHGYERR